MLERTISLAKVYVDRASGGWWSTISFSEENWSADEDLNEKKNGSSSKFWSSIERRTILARSGAAFVEVVDRGRALHETNFVVFVRTRQAIVMINSECAAFDGRPIGIGLRIEVVNEWSFSDDSELVGVEFFS